MLIYSIVIIDILLVIAQVQCPLMLLALQEGLFLVAVSTRVFREAADGGVAGSAVTQVGIVEEGAATVLGGSRIFKYDLLLDFGW